MIIKDTFCVDLEGLRDRGGRATYFIAMEDSQRKGTFHIGGYRYDSYGQPVDNPHAPKVIDVWSVETETRQHAKTRRMSMGDVEFFKAAEQMQNAHLPWKDRTRLYEISAWKSLTGTCQACGLAVTHPVRQLIEEARYGARTIAEIEAVSVCRRVKCRGRISIEFSNEK